MIAPRRGPRHYCLLLEFKTIIQVDGRSWLEKQGGIVVYKSEEVQPFSLVGAPHIWLAPHHWESKHVPITIKAPEEFTSADNTRYVAIDLITLPRKPLHGDPWISAALHLRKYFGHLKLGDRTRLPRVYDIWPQPGQASPIWQWEPKALK